MKLKSLQMSGFKSFAEKTIIEFEPGFNALVGPNGCGKSNVVDAIKWVLGEKSARSIRGEKMEDVIFAGTDSFKAQSMAEVKLVFENKSGILPISGDSIAVVRRLYRDGESEYLINDQKVRLKEIERIFFDTGVGKHAYSVMEQGKIDQIISTKPEDRRYIFEEAAGISRYKHQKKETLKKLEETNVNIQRIQDILREIDRERNVTQKQAEKTQEYQELKKNLSLFEIKLYVDQGERLLEKAANIDERLQNLTMRREELSAKVSSVNAIIEEKEYKKNAIQLELFEHDKKLLSFRHSLQHLDEHLSRNRRLLEDTNNKIRNIEGKIEERHKNLSSIQEKINTLDRQEEEVKQKLRQHEDKLTDLRNRESALVGQIEKNKETLKTNKGRIEFLDREIQQLQEKIKEVIGELVIAIEKRKSELVQEEETRQSYQQEIYQSLDNYHTRLSNFLKELEHIEKSPSEQAVEEFKQFIVVNKEKLTGINFAELRGRIERFAALEDGFRSIFFQEGGIQSQKEELQKNLEDNQRQKEELNHQNRLLEEEQPQLESKKNELSSNISDLKSEISKDNNEMQWLSKQRDEFNLQLFDVQSQITQYSEEINEHRKEIENWNQEIRDFEKQLYEFSGQEDKIKESIQELSNIREELQVDVEKHKLEIHRESEELKNLNPKILDFEKSLLEVKLKDEQVKEYLYTQYELDFSEAKLKADELEKLQNEKINFQQKVAELKRKIDSLGVINHLAIEELQDLEERHSFYQQQLDDMDVARKDIVNLLQDIDRESLQLFTKTFVEIRSSFARIFQVLFEGGEADIMLIDPEQPLDSGVDIVVQPPGKKPKHLSLLSGGEKSLIAIALLFAVYETKPSPFCFLDEIDAALDENNVSRFITMLKEFSESTQFIVITHNKRTMSMANTIYGVTMEKAGISKLVSMKLEKIS